QREAGMENADRLEEIGTRREIEQAIWRIRPFFRNRNELRQLPLVRIVGIVSGIADEGIAVRIANDLYRRRDDLQLHNRDIEAAENEKEDQRDEEIEPKRRNIAARAPVSKSARQLAGLKQ